MYEAAIDAQVPEMPSNRLIDLIGDLDRMSVDSFSLRAVKGGT
jgi:hypothetical protein